jgi:hypothetical protein
MQPFFNRTLYLDPKAPVFIPALPLAGVSGDTKAAPYAKPIKKGCEFDKQIDRVDQRLITLKPNHSHDICQKEKWIFPEISFTVKELREYLESNLGCEGWIVGGAANPACLPYNDIDMGFYIENPNYPQIDSLILEFIKAKLIEKRSAHPHYFPIDKGWLIQKVFFSGRVLFKENAGAFYGLQDLQIKIFQSPVFHCVSPADGAQVSPKSRVLRFAMGKKFATTKEEFSRALSYCRRKIYEIVDVEGHRDLLFRLVFKKSTGHKVEARLFRIAIQQLQVQLQQEYKEKSAMSLARHTFQRIDSRQKIPTILELLVGKLKNHQTNHFVSAKGKIIDFFNFMTILSTQQQREFAQAWLNNTEALGLTQINAFAKLIVHSPDITPLLLKLMRGVFFCEWANQSDGQKGRLFAFERCLPEVQEVIDEPSVKEEEYPNEPGMHIAMKDGEHTYFLSLEENSSPVQIAKDLLDCIPELEALAKKCAPEGLSLLKEAFIQLNFDPAYVSAEKGTHIEKRLLTAFDSEHVKDILQNQFNHHYGPNTVLKDPKVILTLIGSNLKDPKDRQVHAYKMSLASIERLAKRAEELQLADLAQCCRLILKYSSPSSSKPSMTDLELLIRLSDQILKGTVLNKFGLKPFFENHFAFLIPHIFKTLLANLDQENFNTINQFYEMAVNLDLLNKQQEGEFLFDYLKALESYPKMLSVSYTLAMRAFEKGIQLNQNFLIVQLLHLLKSDSKYVDFIYRYLMGISDWKNFEREPLLKLIIELLETSFKSEEEDLNKKGFEILNKLKECDVDLLNSLFVSDGLKILEHIQSISRKKLASKTIPEPIIFDVLGMAIAATKEKIGCQSALKAFELQIQLRPDVLNLSQIENMAQTAIWLLENSVKMDRITQTEWLDKLVLPLLGITFAKVKTNKYKDLGLKLLNLLTLKDQSKEWLKVVRERILSRIANVVCKQKAVIRAQEQLETFTNALVKIAYDNQLSDFIYMGRFQTHLANKDFLSVQPERIKILQEAIKEIDKNLLSLDSFKPLQSHLEKTSEVNPMHAEKTIAPPEDIIKAADELYMLANDPKNYRIAKINQLGSLIIRSLKSLPFESISKEMLIALNKSVSQTIKGLASCPKIKLLILARDFLSLTSISKLIEPYQKGQVLLELLKGYITIEKLNPQNDYSKELHELLTTFLKQHELNDQSLDIDGYFAILTLLEKMYKGPWQEVQQTAELLERLCLNPSKAHLVRQKIVSSTCRFIQGCLDSQNEIVNNLGFILFMGLANSPLFSHQEAIHACFEKILDQVNADTKLHEIFIKLKVINYFEGLTFDLKTKMITTLLRTQNLKMYDWIFTSMSKKTGKVLEAHEIYVNTLKILIHICEHTTDMKIINSAYLFYNLNVKQMRPLLTFNGLHSFADDCEFLLCTRIPKKEMLLKACELYEKSKLSDKPLSLSTLLVGISNFPFIQFDSIVQENVWRVLKDLENSKIIEKLNLVNISKITGLLLTMIKNAQDFDLKFRAQMVEHFAKFLNILSKISADSYKPQKNADQLFSLCYGKNEKMDFQFLYRLNENVNKSSLSQDVKKHFFEKLREFVLIEHKSMLEFAQTKIKGLESDPLNITKIQASCIEFVEKAIVLMPFYAEYFPDEGRLLVDSFAKKIFSAPNNFGAVLIFYELWKKIVEVDLYKEKSDKGLLIKDPFNAKKTRPINIERLEKLALLLDNLIDSRVELDIVIEASFDLLPQAIDFYTQDPRKFFQGFQYPFGMLCLEKSLIDGSVDDGVQQLEDENYNGKISYIFKYLQMVRKSNLVSRHEGVLTDTADFFSIRYSIINGLILLPALINCLHLKLVPSWGVLPCLRRMEEDYVSKKEDLPGNLSLLKRLVEKEPTEFKGLLSSLIFSHPVIFNRSMEIFGNIDEIISSLINRCQKVQDYVNILRPTTIGNAYYLSFKMINIYIEDVLLCLKETKNESLKNKEIAKINAYFSFAKAIVPQIFIPEVCASLFEGLNDQQKYFEAALRSIEKEWRSKKEKKKDSASEKRGTSAAAPVAAGSKVAKKKKGKKR